MSVISALVFLLVTRTVGAIYPLVQATHRAPLDKRKLNLDYSTIWYHPGKESQVS
jgi:hypothetical protein